MLAAADLLFTRIADIFPTIHWSFSVCMMFLWLQLNLLRLYLSDDLALVVVFRFYTLNPVEQRILGTLLVAFMTYEYHILMVKSVHTE